MQQVQSDSPVDLTIQYKKCFPTISGRSEVVRNQGTCGSCWAFAAASVVMADLCISKQSEDTMNNESDRIEISVSQMMKCNDYQFGCEGGNALAVQTALKRGIARERSDPYQCGGGNALNHFEKDSAKCGSFPWGAGNCNINTIKRKTWTFHAAFKMDGGESQYRDWVARGHAMYVTFFVRRNFMLHDWARYGVYTSTSRYTETGVRNVISRVIGSHAVALVGYGTGKFTDRDWDYSWWDALGVAGWYVGDSLHDIDYWKLQNSWGTSWGENGFFKMLRGKNLCGIESGGVSFHVSVHGGACPSDSDNDANCVGDGSTWGNW
eukprot:TRINITY_DN23883_c0_g1_i1.p1 TRINITY_DN23883_c0_g1~~TRINITY_DN23883_c0_g1_i1.p1  ORF type:complete len:335 (-),score=2.62 TRINITY_DN23883_c0_g1_i1:24-989(-)